MKEIVKVYFESKNHAEHVATFFETSLYDDVYSLLEKKAKAMRMILTESVEEIV